MSDATPYVSGKRLILACHSASRGGPVVLGTFSCHWAAVAALVRLHQPDFKSLGVDRLEDLAIETGLQAAIARATGLPMVRPTPRRVPTNCGYCSYEEADGELIEQCPKCKAFDAKGAAA